jgi:hypothetical protein
MADPRKLLAARPDRAWVLPLLLFLLAAAGTLGPDSYFLHHDTPTQSVAAADLLNGCWGYTAATLAPAVFLSLPYALFGLNPVWEMILLSLLGAVMGAAFFRLAAQMTGSRRWALLGSLWFFSLPVILYYTRMHIGYPLAFFTLGVMLHTERRYTWAGVALGLAFTSHFNYVVPVAAWLGWTFLLDRETRRWRALVALGLGLLAPLFVLETARYLYSGIPFGWIRAEIEDALRLSGGMSEATQGWPITHLLHLIAFSNGWLNLVLLLGGLAYPLLRRPRIPLMDAVFLAGWSVIGFYSVRVSLMRNTFLTPRMFSAAYPLAALAAVFTLRRGLGWIAGRLSDQQQRAGRIALALLVVIVLPVSTIGHVLDAQAGSATGYVEAGQAAGQAADAGLPVRYFGNPHVGYFLGQRYGAEVSINETSAEIVQGDTLAVLIIEDAPGLAESDLLPDPSLYVIASYPHRAVYRPAAAENYGIGPDILRELSDQTARQRGSLEVWWPRHPAGTFEARTVHDESIYHYEGGCTIPPRFIWTDGERVNYYVLLEDKLHTIWAEVKAGHLRAAFTLIRDWIVY